VGAPAFAARSAVIPAGARGVAGRRPVIPAAAVRITPAAAAGEPATHVPGPGRARQLHTLHEPAVTVCGLLSAADDSQQQAAGGGWVDAPSR